MKIFPRSIAISSDGDHYSLYLRNSASDDRVLMFKIRRSEHKMVEFTPKTGYVEAGTTSTIALKVVDRSFPRARLLVKLAVVKKSLLENDFERDWQVASKRNGEVKKVIDIVNQDHAGVSHRNGANSKQLTMEHSLASRVRSTDSADIFSETSSVSMSHLSVASAAFYSPSTTANSSPTSAARSQFDDPSQADQSREEGQAADSLLGEPHHAEHSAQDVGDEEYSNNDSISKQFTKAGENREPMVEEEGRANAVTPPAHETQADQAAVLAELVHRLVQSPNTATLLSGLLRALPVPVTVPARPPAAPAPSAVPAASPAREHLTRAEQTRRFIGAEGQPFPSVRRQEQEKDKGVPVPVEACSRVTELSAGKGSVHAGAVSAGVSVMIEVTGEAVHVEDGDVARVLAARLEQVVEGRQKVTAIEISACALCTLRASLGRLYSEAEGADPLVHKLQQLRSAILEDSLRHLSANACALRELDSTVNRFRNLRSLNLSGNDIRCISAPLELHELRSLDLSANRLTSLDYLQLLTNLTTLIVSDNKICSLRLSVNMLVPLSKTLVSLDMAGNPVCGDKHYAQEVVQVLPRLRYFDAHDLQAMEKAYSYSFRASGTSGGARRTTPDLPSEKGRRLSRSGRYSTSASTSDHHFERRLQAALALRRRWQRTGEPEEGERRADHSLSASRDNKQAVLTPRSSRHGSRRPDRYATDTPSGDEIESPALGGDNEVHDSDSGSGSEDTAQMREIERFVQELSGRSEALREDAHHSHDEHRHQDNSKRSGLRRSGSGTVGDDSNSSLTGGNTTRPTPATTHSHVSTADSEHIGAVAMRAVLLEDTAIEAVKKVPRIPEDSSLLEPTCGLLLRRRVHGVADRTSRFPQHPLNASNSVLYSSLTLGEGSPSRSASRSPDATRTSRSRGYFSESEVTSRRSARSDSARKAAAMAALSEQQFLEMQEEERYGAWHPRYRVPKPIFGFSKPFIHRRTPSLKDHAPLFDSTVQRMRESFRRAPARGTFSRAGKGLPADWYPMDFVEVEAIRRHGYFSDTIGEVSRDSFRDPAIVGKLAVLNHSHSHSAASRLNSSGLQSTEGARNRPGSGVPDFLQEALVSPRGSVSLSPQKPGRRQTWGPHMSRFDPSVSVVQPADDFSGFRKWHAGLLNSSTIATATVPVSANTGDVKGDEWRTASVSWAEQSVGDVRRDVVAGQPQPVPDVSVSPSLSLPSYSAAYSHRNVAGDAVEGPAAGAGKPVPPPLPADQQPPSAHFNGDKEGRVSVESEVFAADALFHSGVEVGQDNSTLEEDRQVYNAIPDFPPEADGAAAPAVACSTPSPFDAQPTEMPAEAAESQESLVSPALRQLSEMSQRIDAEEAELASYLSWLDSQQLHQHQHQHHQEPQQNSYYAADSAVQSVAQAEAQSRDGTASVEEKPPQPSRRTAQASAIPRYSSSSRDRTPTSSRAPRDGDRDEQAPVGRVFSPREAAQRAEQLDTAAHQSSQTIGRASRSAFHSSSGYGSYSFK